MNWKTGKCSNCGGELHLGRCPDYGVPTGVVPRVATSGWVQRVDTAVPPRVDPAAELERDLLVLGTMSFTPGDVMRGIEHLIAPPHLQGPFAHAVQQAVDDYLLMERKALAWDELRAELVRWGDAETTTVAFMDALLKPHP